MTILIALLAGLGVGSTVYVAGMRLVRGLERLNQ